MIQEDTVVLDSHSGVVGSSTCRPVYNSVKSS